ncbi:MAG: hypothetical protein AAF654_07770 [Myxococcota bacterium]
MRRTILLSVAGLIAPLSCSDDADSIRCGAGTVQIGDVCQPVADTTRCGSGAVEIDGECVDEADDLGCGDGTVESNGTCVPSDTACASGTVLVGGACTPVPSLAGLTVSVEVDGCGRGEIVDGLVGARLSVLAVDDAGEPFDAYSGTLRLLGLGGIAVTPNVLEVVDGAATVSVSVQGTSEAASVVVFDVDTPTIGGSSSAFQVVAERFTFAPVGDVDFGTGDPAHGGFSECRDRSGGAEHDGGLWFRSLHR